MTEFLAEYGLFLLKTATIVLAIVVVIGSGASGAVVVEQDGTYYVGLRLGLTFGGA